MSLELDYFYGAEAEQYSFYRIPKVLLTDRHFRSVSMYAKVLYGLMLDRMGLSLRNGWLDDGGRVYIYFTLEDALEMLDCGKNKAVRLFKELDRDGGIGLIERRKQGQGKPARIYVKNFTVRADPREETAAPGASDTNTHLKGDTEWRGFLCQTRKSAQGILYVFPSGLTKYDAKKAVANVLFY